MTDPSTRNLDPSTARNITRDVTLPDLKQHQDDFYQSQIQVWPARSIWPSSLGHPCERQQVYHQTEWQHKMPHDVGLERVFQNGRRIGDQIVRDLQKQLAPHGIAVEQQEVRIPENPEGVSGKIDCVLRWTADDGAVISVPGEAKGLADHSWQKLKTLHDMLNADAVYVRGYVTQLLAYLHYTGSEYGVFIMRNKTTNEDRFIWMHYDWQLAKEWVVEKARRIQAAVTAYRASQQAAPDGQGDPTLLPKRIPWEGSVCGRCPYRFFCCPDMASQPGCEDLLWDTTLNALCHVRHDTAGDAAEYRQVHEKIKKHVATTVGDRLKKAGDSCTLLTTDWVITVKRTANGQDRMKFTSTEKGQATT